MSLNDPVLSSVGRNNDRVTENAQQDQAARTCRLILLCVFRKKVHGIEPTEKDLLFMFLTLLFTILRKKQITLWKGKKILVMSISFFSNSVFQLFKDNHNYF